jgi:hypothetical protein
MTTGSLSAIAPSLALWPGLFLVAGGVAKAVDVSRGDVGGTVLARLVDGRAPQRAVWALVAAAELAVGVLVVAGLAVPWPEVAAALLLAGAGLVAVWGIRNAPDAGCGCIGARSTAKVDRRTVVRAGLLAILAALAAAGGASWMSALDESAAVVAVVVAGIALAWLSPELSGLRNAVAPRLAGPASRVRRLRAAACSRRVSLERSVGRLRRSELWERARPYLSTDEPIEHWDEGCWRLLCYPAVFGGEAVTAVFAVNLGLGQVPNRVAFVNEAERRVVGGLAAGQLPT